MAICLVESFSLGEEKRWITKKNQKKKMLRYRKEEVGYSARHRNGETFDEGNMAVDQKKVVENVEVLESLTFCSLMIEGLENSYLKN